MHLTHLRFHNFRDFALLDVDCSRAASGVRSNAHGSGVDGDPLPVTVSSKPKNLTTRESMKFFLQLQPPVSRWPVSHHPRTRVGFTLIEQGAGDIEGPWRVALGQDAQRLAAQRGGLNETPACGAYFDESTLPPLPGQGGSGTDQSGRRRSR